MVKKVKKSARTCQVIFEEIVSTIGSTSEQLSKFNDGNMSAGTRVRKAMQAIKVLAQELRVKVQQTKNK